MLYFDNVISVILGSIIGVNLGLRHDFLYGMESTLFFHLCIIDFPSLPPTFSLCQLSPLPLLLPPTPITKRAGVGTFCRVFGCMWSRHYKLSVPSSGANFSSTWFQNMDRPAFKRRWEWVSCSPDNAVEDVEFVLNMAVIGFEDLPPRPHLGHRMQEPNTLMRLVFFCVFISLKEYWLVKYHLIWAPLEVGNK